MNDFVSGFQKIIDIISSALSILDFSYVVSGSIGFMIINSILYKCYPNIFEISSGLGSNVVILFSIVLIYTFGLLLSSIGNVIRKNVLCEKYRVSVSEELKKNNSLYKEMLNLGNVKFDVADDEEKARSQYALIWSELSKKEEATGRINFINRFWVMQKVYEGLMADSLLGFLGLLVFAIYSSELSSTSAQLVFVAVSFLISIFCFCVFTHEANKCVRTQVCELVAAYYVF